MLEEMQSLALLGLLICQYYLIRGCLGINEAIPAHGGEIAGRIDRTADLLDEVAQLISDLSDAASIPAKTQTPSSPVEALLSAFMTRTAMASHGSQEFEGTIYENEVNDTPPVKV